MDASPPHGEPPPSLDCLPSDILDMVVSRLPVRDAVRTSALSRAWRRRWETAPGIRFILSDSDVVPPKAQAAIDAFLARYACPVRHFVYDNMAFPHADQVLALLASKGVEYLYFNFAELHTIHPAVFSCNALTHLFLDRCYLPPAPSSFSGFPNLTCLQLSHVGVREHGERDLEAMIQMSPLLTRLDLDYVWIEADEVGEWVIRAPNLHILSIESNGDYYWQTEELPSLQQASIKVGCFSTGRDFVRLLTHLRHVTELEFHMPVKFCLSSLFNKISLQIPGPWSCKGAPTFKSRVASAGGRFDAPTYFYFIALKIDKKMADWDEIPGLPMGN